MTADTDKLIQKFLKTIKRTGLGKHLFNEMRLTKTDQKKLDFCNWLSTIGPILS